MAEDLIGEIADLILKIRTLEHQVESLLSDNAQLRADAIILLDINRELEKRLSEVEDLDFCEDFYIKSPTRRATDGDALMNSSIADILGEE